ncbi:MAG: HAD family hydrolase [Nitrosopumilus sp.]|uniref:D-glycero-alpha-D-manno-heptose-1,7-bisphosphate 7-phosphatase n=1 Tax=Nitrosopumilus sp. TaxID=2024843 RepID=UPI00247CF8E6|nr:HAD family hydrolase [Nitrosopumilus sp.]MCV0393728.1 HAD family hydrolase [Nitrosopumilus sp.]
MNKAVFLDRDGVITKRTQRYLTSIDELELLPNIEKWLKLLSKQGFHLFVITNQSMIGREISTVDTLEKIHTLIQKKFKTYDFQITKFYFCPHNPDDGCYCRKPKPGLILKAINEFSIDIKNSWLIGDEDTDIILGKNVGCNTIKIETNTEIKDAVYKILNS